MRDLALRNGVVIKAAELEMRFSRSSGPGGQNVNKLNTKAMLRFHPASSASLTAAQKEAVSRKLAPALTESGEIIVFSDKTRSRAMNAGDALAKLGRMLESALRTRTRRVPTRPTASAGKRRLESKSIRGRRKKLRARPVEGED